jgi:hypothetical protein
MLCMNTYEKEYIDACRARMEAQLAAYDAMAARAEEAAVAEFAPRFFSSLVIVLEGSFVHRTRSIEGKDGNPMNEVRMLCNSILLNNAVLAADKTIKYKPASSVLKIEIGQEITLTRQDFGLLMDAYFAAIETTFTARA